MPLTDKEFLQINQALFSLAHAYESRMAQENFPEETGLTVYDCAILMVIGQSAPISSSELAQRMDVAASTISVYVRRLTKKGLVDMERDERDRRMWWLHLTESGQSAYDDVIAGTIRYTRDFISMLNLEEQQTLHRLLLQISHALGFTWQ